MLTERKVKIGVLALQGGFIEHIKMLQSLNVETFEIRNEKDLAQDFRGLIIPGGESTTMVKLLNDLNMFDSLKTLIDNGMPVLGTCAGLILLAKHIVGSDQHYLNAIDIEVKRNAYGRQLGSFYTEDLFEGIGTIPMVFIRAPYIEKTGTEVTVLSRVNGEIVAAKEKNVLVLSFHPELTSDTRVHKYFIDNFIHN